MVKHETLVLPDLDAVSREAAHRFTTIAEDAINRTGRFMIALAGGATPERLYRLLASDIYRGQVKWESVHIFFGDERCVPPDDAQSNYRTAREALLQRVAIPPTQIYRMEGERNPQDAAAAYSDILSNVFGLTAHGKPRFDLVLLGMGPDGHTASLFPHTDALGDSDLLVAANWVPQHATWRLTLTFPVLNAASNILFLVGGAEKASAVRSVIEGASNPERFPSQGVHPSTGTLVYILDEAAASELAGSAPDTSASL